MRYAAYLLAMAGGAGLLGWWVLILSAGLLLASVCRDTAAFDSLGIAAQPQYARVFLPAVATFGIGLLIASLH